MNVIELKFQSWLYGKMKMFYIVEWLYIIIEYVILLYIYIIGKKVDI